MSSVPEGWNFFPVGNFLRESRIAGGDGTTPNKISVKLYGKGVLAKENGRIGSSATKYFVRKSGQFIYSKLDFLNGAFGIIPDSLEGYQSTLDLPAFDFVGNICPKWFLNTVSQPSFYSAFLGRAAGGRKARRVNPKELLAAELSFPPLPEQKRIAAILSSVNDAIAATEAVIEQTQRVKEGLLQDLLTRGIGHTRFKQTEIGEIPEGWEVKRLEDVTAHTITYGIVQAGPHVDGGVPYIRVSDMSEPELSPENMLRTSLELASKFKRSEVKTGEIVVALRGLIGHVMQVPLSLDGANLTQGTARVSPVEGVDANFLLWSMRAPIVRQQLLREAKGSALKEISLGSLRRVLIPVPPINEQQAIAAKLKLFFDQEILDRKQLAQLQQAKRGLMQDLLSGDVRVAV